MQQGEKIEFFLFSEENCFLLYKLYGVAIELLQSTVMGF